MQRINYYQADEHYQQIELVDSAIHLLNNQGLVWKSVAKIVLESYFESDC